MSRLGRITCAVAIAGAMLPLAQADSTTSSKWRVELDHTAQSDGSIVLQVAPKNGEPIEAEASIPKGRSENEIAHAVRDSLKVALGKGYDVEVDDGEDVLVKARGKTKPFEMKLVSSSVTGLEIELERE
jgi:hypothetical protein